MQKLKVDGPFYSCTGCYEELSHPPEDLHVYEGELWCENCWDDHELPEGVEKPSWYDLPEFADPELAALKAEVERLRGALKIALRVCQSAACLDTRKEDRDPGAGRHICTWKDRMWSLADFARKSNLKLGGMGVFHDILAEYEAAKRYEEEKHG